MISPFCLNICPAEYSSDLSSGPETLKPGLQHRLSGVAPTATGWGGRADRTLLNWQPAAALHGWKSDHITICQGVSRAHKGGQKQLHLWPAMQCQGWWLPSGQRPSHGGKNKEGQRKEKNPFLPFGSAPVSLLPLIILPSKPPTSTLAHSLPHSISDSWGQLDSYPLFQGRRQRCRGSVSQGHACSWSGLGLFNVGCLALKLFGASPAGASVPFLPSDNCCPNSREDPESWNALGKESRIRGLLLFLLRLFAQPCTP